jgi:[ribosomal protein S18]-alanine N-acetyltransferase
MVKLERQSPGAAHWSREQYESLFLAGKHSAGNQETRSEPFVWVVENEAVDPDNVANESWDLFAFLVAHRIDGEWELENMAVALSARRNGIGTLLLKELIAQAGAERGSKIFLEVRESNQGARALYEKIGFEEAGFRKNYYSDPAEDAILYQLSCR